MKQCDNIKLKFNEKMKLKDFTFLGISTNAKGVDMETYHQEEFKTVKELE